MKKLTVAICALLILTSAAFAQRTAAAYTTMGFYYTFVVNMHEAGTRQEKVYNPMNVLMVNQTGTILFKKSEYDDLKNRFQKARTNKRYVYVSDLINLDLSQLGQGKFYNMNGTEDRFKTNGKYYLFSFPMQPGTQRTAKEVIRVPAIFTDSKAKKEFKAKFGEEPNEELQHFLKQNLSEPDFKALLGQ